MDSGRRKHLALATLGLGALGLSAYAWWTATAPTQVATVAPERREIVSTIAIVGRVRAPSRAGLGVSISGTVAEVRVDVGDSVSREELLVVLDDTETRAAVAEAEAALAAQISSSAGEIEQARRDSAQSARDADRMRSVFREGAVTRQRLEQEEQRAADAATRLRVLLATVGEEPASVARYRAARDAAAARLSLTQIRAPGPGVILRRAVEPGDAVSPGRALVDIAFAGPTELIVYPAEENLGQLVLGGRATVSADAYPDSIFDATIVRVAPAVDPSQGTVEVRLAVDRPPAFLRPDMTISVNLETGRRTDAWVVPVEAVRGLGTSAPWIAVVEDGRVARHEVEVGLVADGLVELRSGLPPEARVVTAPDDIAPGERARDPAVSRR
ncbi:MAG: efflux RND transporter periplasmic adaptor subunit [Gemmatimonadetes bacterium]|nr:efflux RND transporter periplasmic adaptor subunit [Gemmatimonadota bacterium]